MLYQKALDLQHKRHFALRSEKWKEMEIAHAELRQPRNFLAMFGEGYNGYGNSITGTRFRIVYPHERKRPRRTREFRL